MNIGNLRREYDHDGLRRVDLLDDPFDQFGTWFKQACDADIIEPNAMSLATASADAHPTLRTVLLKYYDHDGFVFFTNLESTKALQIAQNPNVALLFPWLKLDRQTVITGYAKKVSSTEALNYFITRPRGSQLGAWVSRQSSVISSRSLLEIKLDEMRRKFLKGRIPLPSFWGGYRVKPVQFEFWQGRPNRLHDRFRYTRNEGEGWRIERLAP
jgi:pyridoxamine 5'-phosphate oxidase